MRNNRPTLKSWWKAGGWRKKLVIATAGFWVLVIVIAAIGITSGGGSKPTAPTPTQTQTVLPPSSPPSAPPPASTAPAPAPATTAPVVVSANHGAPCSPDGADGVGPRGGALICSGGTWTYPDTTGTGGSGSHVHVCTGTRHLRVCN